MVQTLAPANIPAGNNKDIHPETRVQDLTTTWWTSGELEQFCGKKQNSI